MAAMAPEKVRKLIGLLGQLGHDNENIRSTAGAAADRLVKSEGLTWEKLIGGMPAPPPPRPPPPKPPPRSSRTRQAWDTDDDARELDELTIDMLRVHAHGEWEQDFVESLAERWTKYGRRTRVSEKQWRVIDRITERAMA